MIAEGNCYWVFGDVEAEIVGMRVMVEVRPGDPLRTGTLVTVDMCGPMPVMLVEDDNGQVWSIAARRVWVEDASDPT